MAHTLHDLALEEYLSSRIRDARANTPRRPLWHMLAEALLVAVSPAVVVLALGVAL